MKSKFLFCLFLFVIIFTSRIEATDAQVNHPFLGNQEEILRFLLLVAEEKNPTIGAAFERVRQAEADVSIAASAMGPKVDANLSGRWYKRESAGVIPVLSQNVYSAALSLSQVLYAGGSLTANKQGAELGLSASKAEAFRVFQSVANSVRVNFYNCHRALAHLKVTEEALSLSKEHLRQAQSLYKAGVAPMGDVLRAKVFVSQAELDRIRTANDLDVYWAVLERSVGQALIRSQILRAAPKDSIPSDYVLPEDPAERALSQRAEITAFDLYRKRAEQTAKSAAGQRLPQLHLNAELNQAGKEFWPDEDNGYVSLGLQWRLYDHGEVAGQVARARAVARELLFQLDDLKQQIVLEVTQAELRLRAAHVRLDVALDQVEQAREDYRIAMKRYQAQVDTNLNVLDAQNALIRSRFEYVDAVYDIAAAQANLIYAFGDDQPQRQTEPLK